MDKHGNADVIQGNQQSTHTHTKQSNNNKENNRSLKMDVIQFDSFLLVLYDHSFAQSEPMVTFQHLARYKKNNGRRLRKRVNWQRYDLLTSLR